MSEGYGSDLWCDENGLRTDRIVRGPLVVIQAIRRRLTTAPGTLQGVSDDDQRPGEYGFDLPGLIGMVGYASAVHAVPALVRAEIMKDDRVAGVEAAAAVESSGGVQSLTLSLRVTLHDSADVFPLTLAIDQVSVQILTGES